MKQTKISSGAFNLTANMFNFKQQRGLFNQGVSMLKTKIFFITILIVSLFVGASMLFAANNQNIGEEDPIVLVPSYDILTIPDNMPAFPGQDSVWVPILFLAMEDTVFLTGIEFSISLPDGVSLDTFVFSNWEGDYNVYNQGSNIEVQCWGDTVVIPPSIVEYLIITDFYFSVEMSVGPDSTLPISFTDDTYFYEMGDPLAYDPILDNGSIKTYSDSCWVDVADNITGLSSQALNENKDIYVEVPVNLYTSFPCRYFTFLLTYRPEGLLGDNPPMDEWPLQYVGYDTANVKHFTDVYSCGISGYEDVLVFQKVAGSNIDTIHANTQVDSLVTLYFKVNDFHFDYNTDVNFDTLLDVIKPVENLSYFCSYLGGASNYFIYLYEDENFHGGSVYLPEYEVSLGGAYINIYDTTSIVSVPMYLISNFYTQHYETKVKYDTTLLTLQSVTIGDEPFPQNVQYTDLGTYDGWNTIELMTYDLQDDQYVEPVGYPEIYTLNFIPTEHYMTSDTIDAFIYGASGWGYYGLVFDYFSIPGNSVIRASYNEDNFIFLPSRVHRNTSRSMSASDVGDNIKDGVLDVAVIEPLPNIYCLNQNYPNPFNASTNIAFSIAEPGYVTLNIYNMLGKKVKSLISAGMSAGAHQVVWNGTNNKGEIVSSGFYFYSLTADNFQQSKKMLLLK